MRFRLVTRAGLPAQNAPTPSEAMDRVRIEMNTYFFCIQLTTFRLSN
jgi:hypothetical protein